jgi:hypothetical protein
MRGLGLWVLVLAGCASGPLNATRGSGAVGSEVEVVGHVTDACGAEHARSAEAVDLRIAGELDPVGTTRTDETGTFRFRVLPPEDPASTLFVEARGRKALARPSESERAVRVAELVLPCER